MNKPVLYPLRFDPILKDKIWGGSRLRDELSKNASDSCGESWELSGVKGDTSVVNNGALQGKSLTEVIDIYKGDLLGDKVFKRFGNQFPLLIKFIDAQADLSIQLHPDDVLAKKKHDSFGKTEMWYVMQANPDARLIIGLKEGTTKDEYIAHVNDKTIEDVLEIHSVKPGDSFFISPGLIHAIGGGVLLAEIQQTSDITYRVYDYERKDDQGNQRDLHLDDALEAMDFNHPGDYKIAYTAKKNKAVPLVEHEYFKTSVIQMDGVMVKDYSSMDSFVIFIGIDKQTKINAAPHSTVILNKGETVLFPAGSKKISFSGDDAKLLEVFI